MNLEEAKDWLDRHIGYEGAELNGMKFVKVEARYADYGMSDRRFVAILFKDKANDRVFSDDESAIEHLVSVMGEKKFTSMIEARVLSDARYRASLILDEGSVMSTEDEDYELYRAISVKRAVSYVIFDKKKNDYREFSEEDEAIGAFIEVLGVDDFIHVTRMTYCGNEDR